MWIHLMCRKNFAFKQDSLSWNCVHDQCPTNKKSIKTTEFQWIKRYQTRNSFFENSPILHNLVPSTKNNHSLKSSLHTSSISIIWSTCQQSFEGKFLTFSHTYFIRETSFCNSMCSMNGVYHLYLLQMALVPKKSLKQTMSHTTTDNFIREIASTQIRLKQTPQIDSLFSSFV